MKKIYLSARICFPPYLVFIAFSLVMWSLARTVYLSYLFNSRAPALPIELRILVQGIRFDIITLGYLLAIPVLLSLALSPFNGAWLKFKRLLMVYLCLAFAAILFMELSTPSFIDQYDVRPNYLFVEYLKYPKEVFATLIKGYSVDLIAALMVVPSLTLLLYFILSKFSSNTVASKTGNLVLAPLVILIFFIGIRSSFSHRPANPASVAMTSDPMVNSLALNSTYSLLYAVYLNRRDEDGTIQYGSLPIDRVLDVVKANIQVPEPLFVDNSIPTLHVQNTLSIRDKPLNLVIILEESLGAEFVGALGGLPLTPNLDALKDNSIWFEHMYATGTRSVRGIEAVITGFPPTPASSVVKLQKSQKNFFTIAELLSRKGYDTSFIYGGAAHFDNMRGFFVSNGFNTVIEEKDFASPKFKGSWGVSDEDLFTMADFQFSKKVNKPFFSLVFSSSNHSPFEYPTGKIEPYDREFNTVNNAVKYADFALGQFIKKAKQSSYWHNTLFVVVADHNSRVYGNELVPIKRFHIPCAVFGGAVQPERYNTIASQLDLTPTLLSMMGITSNLPTVGVNLMTPQYRNGPGRAIMQFHQSQAYMQGDDVVILQPQMAPAQFQYTNNRLHPSGKPNKQLVETALAYSVFGPYAYNHGIYRLPSVEKL